MSSEIVHGSQKNEILATLTHLFKTGPDAMSDDDTVEQWGRSVEAEEKKALDQGIPRIDIEFTKFKGLNPKDRKLYLSVLNDDYEISRERGEAPEISRRELRNLRRRVNRLDKRTNL